MACVIMACVVTVSTRQSPRKTSLCIRPRMPAHMPMNITTERRQPPKQNQLRCVALRCVALRCVAVRCRAMRCGAVRCGALRCVAVRDAMRGAVLCVRAFEHACVRVSTHFFTHSCTHACAHAYAPPGRQWNCKKHCRPKRHIVITAQVRIYTCVWTCV